MKIKKIAVNETKGEGKFINKTKDQFPYVESVINVLDNNFNWWKNNWKELEEDINHNLNKLISNNTDIKIFSRFTIFHGNDDEVQDVVWTGPAIVYTFKGTTTDIIEQLRDLLTESNLYKGHRVFVYEDQLIILFG